ncbi:MAG TPA: SulP family inorganic anion transporter [Rhodopila sp.]|uniref:SulP family inorganic anion transporter n=1 Tax=Rhodopila sp. TaxID=2480087 RepID=UPI002D0810A7|nr:SulP family inorganic anion transporter [Rhodopila sp.]HVY14895.1 SulP family inorganic anion transporter [Rhodopila sp.]
MIRDVTAGISVAGLLLPSAIAYAGIAGLAPGHAIVATIAGLAAYAALGRSRFAMVAPTSSSAAILAALLLSEQVQGSNAASVTEAAVLAAGLCFVAAGVAQLGVLASFISRPVLRGFTLGIAITITVKQLPAITGVQDGRADTLPLLWHLLLALPSWRLGAVLLGVAALAAILLIRRYSRLPAPALVLAAGVGLSAAADLPAHGVALVGALPVQWPHLAWPDLSPAGWSGVAELAAPLFLILFAESWGSIRGFALLHGDRIMVNRELVALGCANLLSGIAQGMPVGAGFSASAAAETAGARTRMAGVAAMAAMLVLAVWGRTLIALLPMPVLAAIVIASLAHALDPAPLARLWYLRRDAYVAATAVLSVLLLGVLDGMLLAVAISVLALLQRLSGASVSELGRLPGTTDFTSRTRHPEAEAYPGLLILRPAEPLFFANAERVLTRIARWAEDDASIRQVILSLEESSDLDSTAIDALAECDEALRKAGRRLLLARTKDHIRDAIARTAPDLASDARCFHSVVDAYTAATAAGSALPEQP